MENMEDKDKEIRDAFANIEYATLEVYKNIHILEKYVDSKSGKDDIYHIFKKLKKIDSRVDDLKNILKL